MSQQDQNNNKKYPIEFTGAIITMNRALWGEVSPALRAAKIAWNNVSVCLFFYYDGEISEEDSESAECIATEFISAYPEYELEVKVIRLDFPAPIPPQGELVYWRRETNPTKKK